MSAASAAAPLAVLRRPAVDYLLIVAVINIHHFIVDAFIWRLRRDPSYAAVAGAPSP
jgi:hypothetical protein